jgi:1,4-alpha-glucan branching enzyme
MLRTGGVSQTSDPNRLNLAGVLSQLNRSYNGDPLQRVVFVDSHDSAANGSARLNEVIAPGKAVELFARRQSVLAATLLLTAPGIPMLLQGQEFVMYGDFNDWEGLDWANAEKYKGIVVAYHDLIALRRNLKGLTAGLADVIVVVNFGEHDIMEYKMGFPLNGKWCVRFNSNERKYSHDFTGTHVSDFEVQQNTGTFVLPASTALIFSQG